MNNILPEPSAAERQDARKSPPAYDWRVNDLAGFTFIIIAIIIIAVE